jgi:hypothetical protein
MTRIDERTVFVVSLDFQQTEKLGFTAYMKFEISQL